MHNTGWVRRCPRAARPRLEQAIKEISGKHYKTLHKWMADNPDFKEVEENYTSKNRLYPFEKSKSEHF